MTGSSLLTTYKDVHHTVDDVRCFHQYEEEQWALSRKESPRFCLANSELRHHGHRSPAWTLGSNAWWSLPLRNTCNVTPSFLPSWHKRLWRVIDRQTYKKELIPNSKALSVSSFVTHQSKTLISKQRYPLVIYQSSIILVVYNRIEVLHKLAFDKNLLLVSLPTFHKAGCLLVNMRWPSINQSIPHCQEQHLKARPASDKSSTYLLYLLPILWT